MNAQEVIRKLDGWYGPGKGMRVFAVVMPGILADFRKMMQASPGKQVQEEYILEDRKGTLILSGHMGLAGEEEILVSFRDGVPLP